MSKSKHTPGPWKAVKCGVTNTIETNNGASLLAMMDHYTDEDEANAKLMAAAPEMLEALEELKATNSYWWQDVDENLLVKIESVIKKAKGDKNG